MSGSKIVTVQRHIIEQERDHPEATGDLTGLLWDLTIAAKIISREVNRAGLADILGLTGQENIHGEEVKKLDEYANDAIIKSMDHGGHLCVMASEENEDIIPIPDQYPKGKYVLMFDPLDGSSNIDANVSVGTIFSVYRRKTTAGNGTLEDCLRKGVEAVCGGFIVYGSSTMLVYTAGHGSHGFTLDPGIGEFLLSHKNIQIPSRGKVYSINEGNANTWDEGTRKYINDLKTGSPETGQKPYSLRYIGSLVADFHRNLLYGGIFLYPADYKDPNKPKSKLRLLYEAAPLAFIVEQAGGKASTGNTAIMEIKAEQLHQKTPLIIGSKEDVEKYEVYFKNK